MKIFENNVEKLVCTVKICNSATDLNNLTETGIYEQRTDWVSGNKNIPFSVSGGWCLLVMNNGGVPYVRQILCGYVSDGIWTRCSFYASGNVIWDSWTRIV